MRPGAAGAILALAALSGSAAQAGEPPPPPSAPAVLEREFDTLLGWFAGEFDNAEQVAFAVERGYLKDAVPDRLHSTFAPVNLPAVGPHVFYVEQYSDNDPAKVYRQRIYSFSIDKAARAIRLDIFTPKDAGRVRGGQDDAAKLAGLTPADLEATPGCEVYWRRSGGQFVGYMRPGACRIDSKRSGKTIIVTDDLLLGPDLIVISDQAHDLQGGWVFGNKAGIPSELRRSRRWTCWMAAPRTAAKPDGGESWFYARGLRLHDGGGEAWVKTDDPQPREIGFRLRQVEWPTGTNANALTLYALRKGEEKAVGYAWADPAATRIGLNLRWVQGSCTRDGAR